MLGAIVGWLAPSIATNDWIEFLGLAFVKLVKMAIAPIIFLHRVRASRTSTRPKASVGSA